MEAYHQVGRISAHCHAQGHGSEYSPLEKCNYRLLLRSIAVHNAAHNAACILASRIAALHVMHADFILFKTKMETAVEDCQWNHAGSHCG